MNKENVYVNRLNTILIEVKTNISQYNNLYTDYLAEQSNNCPNNMCVKKLTSMEQINSHLNSITKEAQQIVKNLSLINNNYKIKYSNDSIKLDNVDKKIKSQQIIINKLKKDLLNLDTQNNNMINTKKRNSTLVIIISLVSIVLLITTLFLIKNNYFNVLLIVIIIIIIVYNIFSVTYV